MESAHNRHVSQAIPKREWTIANGHIFNHFPVAAFVHGEDFSLPEHTERRSLSSAEFICIHLRAELLVHSQGSRKSLPDFPFSLAELSSAACAQCPSDIGRSSCAEGKFRAMHLLLHPHDRHFTSMAQDANGDRRRQKTAATPTTQRALAMPVGPCWDCLSPLRSLLMLPLPDRKIICIPRRISSFSVYNGTMASFRFTELNFAECTMRHSAGRRDRRAHTFD